jgi:hypothetical protein
MHAGMASRAIVRLAIFGAAVVYRQSPNISFLLDGLPLDEPATLIGSVVAINGDKAMAVAECASDAPLSALPADVEPRTITQAPSVWEYELVREPSSGVGAQYKNPGALTARVNFESANSGRTMLHMICELDASVGTCALTGLTDGGL